VPQIGAGDVVALSLRQDDPVPATAVVTAVHGDRWELDWVGAAPPSPPLVGDTVTAIVERDSGPPLTILATVASSPRSAGRGVTLSAVEVTGRAERRRHDRVESTLRVRWTPQGGTGTSGGGDTVDVGGGGVYVELADGEAPEEGQSYRLSLRLPRRTVTLGARCVAVDDVHCRFQFIAVPTGASNHLRRHVEELRGEHPSAG
jgi:PilZ domain